QEHFHLFHAEVTGPQMLRNLVAVRSLGFEPKKVEINREVKLARDRKTNFFFFLQFLTVMTQKMSENSKKEIKLFDDDETGKITFKNLKHTAKTLGKNLTDEKLQKMIDGADQDGDREASERKTTSLC
uniref:EF-hand domain-containing protein n=1 Tax=Otolemur garnettii TaxID=30611 RepID=H0XKL8_OTOGA